jgi:hypothetical protein
MCRELWDRIVTRIVAVRGRNPKAGDWRVSHLYGTPKEIGNPTKIPQTEKFLF